MKDGNDFTIDTDKFPNITELASNLHSNNQKIIVEVNPYITAEDL